MILGVSLIRQARSSGSLLLRVEVNEAVDVAVIGAG